MPQLHINSWSGGGGSEEVSVFQEVKGIMDYSLTSLKLFFPLPSAPQT